MELVTRSNGPGLLVLADALYSGWTATVDETPSDILAASYAFRSVFIPSGAVSLSTRL